jgi:hypothetical protein
MKFSNIKSQERNNKTVKKLTFNCLIKKVNLKNVSNINMKTLMTKNENYVEYKQ